jgi:copper oxidase (laccase) domain-containing protein
MEPTLKNLGNTRIYHSTIEDGDMSRTSTSSYQMENNISAFMGKYGISKDNLYFLPLKGTSIIDVVDFDETPKKTLKRYEQPALIEDTNVKPHHFDGCVTFSKSKHLGVTTGDCIPLVLWEPETKLRGILHVGSPGAIGNIVLNLAKLFKDHKVDPKKVQYYMGPCISGDVYDVNFSSVWNNLKAQNEDFKKYSKYLKEKDGGLFFNLREMVKDQLLEIGAEPENIQVSEAFTSDDNSSYYSHYLSHQNNRTNGRFLTVLK